MNDKQRHHILCAVRSRPGSEETASRAIDLALEQNARLTFFHALQARFLDKFSARSSSRKAAYEELAEMVEFSLTMLVEQAHARGVEDVDFIMRRGDFRQEFLNLVDEIHVDIVVVGRPRRTRGQRALSDEQINAFLAELEAKGVTIVN
jgi:nucleotide-binding universal stress UspA family protein